MGPLILLFIKNSRPGRRAYFLLPTIFKMLYWYPGIIPLCSKLREAVVHRRKNIIIALQVYGQKDHVSFVVPIKGKPNEFMISRSREVCRLHWDVEQEREDDGTMPRHWVVVLAKVDKGLISNKFNEGKCDPRGRLWAGLSRSEHSIFYHAQPINQSHC
jgi:sugar lactone lactonase YvrE